MDEKRIKALMIVEIAGRPAEYIKEKLINHTAQLKQIKGVNVISENVFEPKKLEAEKEIYTCFTEVEVEAVSFLKLAELIFDFMPSSVEILEPQEVSLKISDANAILNDLSGRLHKYDEVAKLALIKNQQLVAQFKEMHEKNKENNNQDQKKKEKQKTEPEKKKKPKKKKSSSA